jgi:hypothetical protein
MECDRCGEQIDQPTALVWGAGVLNTVISLCSWFSYRYEKRPMHPNYCRDCAGLFSLYTLSAYAVLAVLIFFILVIQS